MVNPVQFTPEEVPTIRPIDGVTQVLSWALDYVATAVVGCFVRDEKDYSSIDQELLREGIVEPITIHRVRMMQKVEQGKPAEYNQVCSWYIGDDGYCVVAGQNNYGGNKIRTMIAEPVIYTDQELQQVRPDVREKMRAGLCYFIGGYRTPMRTEAVLHSWRTKAGGVS